MKGDKARHIVSVRVVYYTLMCEYGKVYLLDKDCNYQRFKTRSRGDMFQVKHNLEWGLKFALSGF